MTLRDFRRLSLLPLLAASSFAQSSLVGGSIEGSVLDSTSVRLPGVAVVARDLGTHQEREASTDAEGHYRIPELPPGTYEVSVSVPGFSPYRHASLSIPLGATVHLDILLQPGTVNTQVTVTAQPSTLDAQQTSITSTIDAERIEELPVESRNYLNFTLLAPGAGSSAQQPARRSLAPLPDSGFTFGGLRGRSNNITIDGLDNNDDYVGSSRTELSLETVQEFQVVNSGLSAESGGASGGSINVITRTGANDLHGDAFVFLQNGAFDARNPFEADRFAPQIHRYRMGLAAGGPIIRNRTFYYAAFEQERNRSLEDAFIDPAVAAALNRILSSAAFPHLPIRRVNGDPFPTALAETEASAKLNHQLASRNSLMLRYAFTNNREAGDAFNSTGLSDPSARGSMFTLDQGIVGALTSVFNPRSVGDLRFQIADRKAVLRTNNATGPGVDIAGLIDFGRPYDGNGRRKETHDQLSYTYSHTAGRHYWKAGATVNRVREDAALSDGFGGLYVFAGLGDFAAGMPNEFRQAFGRVETIYSVQNFGGFVQDHWSIASKLTLDAGLRYDFEHLPGAFHQDAKNFSPRLGLAYQFAPAWLIRAGYGIFFDRYVLAALNRVLQKSGLTGFEQVLTGSSASALFQSTGGGGLPAPLSILPPSIYRADPRLRTPYSQQASFSIEHRLANNLTSTASYLFVRGVRLSRTVNENLLPPGPLFGVGRLLPAFNGVYQLEDSASSTYQGLSLTLNRRMSNELEFSAAYTFSKTFDNASDFDEQPNNPFDLAAERALSRQDQRHRLVFNALWELPVGDDEDAKQPQQHGWLTSAFQHIEVAPIFTVESGRPVTPLTGIDSNGAQPFPLSARPFGFGRNSFQTPVIPNLDFRLLKYFPFGKTAHLDLVAEAFNLLNHSNVAAINPVFGAGPVAQPWFLQPAAGTGARRIRFSLDYEF